MEHGELVRRGLYLGVDWLEACGRRATAGARTKLYVPLYPLAEWLVFNWWLLTGTTELARTRTHARARHG